MKRISTSELVPGMVVAEDVYTYTNQLLIPRGTILNDKAITKLEFYSIINIRVEDSTSKKNAEEIQMQEDISFSERIKKSPEFREFKKRFDEEVPKFNKMLNAIAQNKRPINLDELLAFTDRLMNNGDSYLAVFDMLHNLRDYDDTTYVHSINVALMCNVFARWLRMSDEEAKMATICGLLHDIGKVAIPEELIKKPGKLTESEYTTVKKHTLEGYNALRAQNVSEPIRNSALMHHERCDGTGYPFGIKNAKIDTYAKMVAIVDVYDAMTSARCYRGPMCPFKVVDIFESEGLQKYDTRFIMTFLENIVNTYMLNRVKLNDGREGEVVFVNRAALSRPTIKSGGEFIDLSANPDLYIEAII